MVVSTDNDLRSSMVAIATTEIADRRRRYAHMAEVVSTDACAVQVYRAERDELERFARVLGIHPDDEGADDMRGPASCMLVKDFRKVVQVLGTHQTDLGDLSGLLGELPQDAWLHVLANGHLLVSRNRTDQEAATLGYVDLYGDGPSLNMIESDASDAEQDRSGDG